MYSIDPSPVVFYVVYHQERCSRCEQFFEKDCVHLNITDGNLLTFLVDIFFPGFVQTTYIHK